MTIAMISVVRSILCYRLREKDGLIMGERESEKNCYLLAGRLTPAASVDVHARQQRVPDI